MSQTNENANDPDDVMVTTQPFALTPKTYFRISLRIMFWNHWWIVPYLLTVFIALELARYAFLTGYFDGEPAPDFAGFILKMEIFLLLFVVLYYGLLCRRIRAGAYHKSNQSVMLPRTTTFSKEKFEIRQNHDGECSHWTYAKSDVFCVATLKKCYLFFITPAMFVFVSKDAFPNDSDRDNFEKVILSEYPP